MDRANTLVRFRYQTDGGVHLPGAFIDDISLKNGGTNLFSDDVEGGVNGWTAAGGFKISTGTESTIGDRYYIAENRAYVGYDATLATGPYQFSFGLTDPDKVEHFQFQDGLLVWMVDETYTDNNNSEHTGHGLALPVDARPVPFRYDNGAMPSNRRQPFDATFGLQPVPDGPTADPEPGSLRCRAPACTRRSSSARARPSPSERSVRADADGRTARCDRGLQRHERRRLLGRDEPAELHQGGRLRHQDHRERAERRWHALGLGG